MAFLILAIAGLVGMVSMALPGIGRHGRFGSAGHAQGHAGQGVHHLAHGHHAATHAAHATGQGDSGAGHGLELAQTARATRSPFWLIPSPRVIFTLMTLVGAIGYALFAALHLPALIATAIALALAVLIERAAVNPLWNLMLKFEGSPSTPLEQLLLTDATAVTEFHHGQGMVSAVRDGRMIQLRAQLSAKYRTMPVNVGDVFIIEEVDPANEKVVVSPR